MQTLEQRCGSEIEEWSSHITEETIILCGLDGNKVTAHLIISFEAPDGSVWTAERFSHIALKKVSH